MSQPSKQLSNIFFPFPHWRELLGVWDYHAKSHSLLGVVTLVYHCITRPFSLSLYFMSMTLPLMINQMVSRVHDIFLNKIGLYHIPWWYVKLGLLWFRYMETETTYGSLILYSIEYSVGYYDRLRGLAYFSHC